MPRKRIELTQSQQAELEVRLARNESAETIHSAMHGVLSVPTLERRKKEFRGSPRLFAAARPASPRPAEGTPTAEGDDAVDRVVALVDDLGALLDGIIERENRRFLQTVFQKMDEERAKLPACPTCGVHSAAAKV